MKPAQDVTEQEFAAVVAELVARFGEPSYDGRGGTSPYSTPLPANLRAEAVVFMTTAMDWGDRVRVTPVVRTYVRPAIRWGRGRWMTVYLISPSAEADRAICLCGDRGAEEVGASGFFTRPYSVQEAEDETAGMGEGYGALAAALRAAGLGD
jgi:hypothetical protein